MFYSTLAQCLKITKNVAVIFLAFSINFAKIDFFLAFLMSHLCSPHKWPMEIGHHKWSLKAIVIPNAKHEGYNGSFLGSRVVTKCHWSRVRTTQIPLFSLLTTSKSPHLPWKFITNCIISLIFQKNSWNAISRIFFEDQWKFLPWWLLSKSEYNGYLDQSGIYF